MRRVSLKWIFFVGFLVLIVVPVIGVNVVLNNQYRASLSSHYSGQVELSLNQIVIGLEDDIKRLSLATSVLINDKELMTDLENWSLEDNKYNKFDLSQSIDKRLNYMFSYSSDVNSLIVVFKDGSNYYYRSDLADDVGEFRNRNWYGDLVENQGKVGILNYGPSIAIEGDLLDVLSAAVSPKPLTINDSIEMVYVEILSPTLKALTLHDNESSHYFVLNPESEVLAQSKGNQEVYELQFKSYDHILNQEKSINNTISDAYYMSFVTSEKTDWKIVYVESRHVITSNINEVLSIFYVVYFVLVTSLLAYVLTLYWSSLKPINHLMTTMEAVKEGNLDVSAGVAGPKEISHLSITFNQMMAQIKTLMKERDIKEEERLEEEKKALQAQINPHFIYNTLNSIKIMAMMSKANNIRKMLESFMKVIELNFKNKGTLISIEDELDYVMAYIDIMKVRYGNFIDVEISVDEDLMDTYIMQMILQPLIENAVIHGLKDKVDGRISITMKAQGQESFCVEVKDNGHGIADESIPDLMTRPSTDRNHIGISNVKRRIEITYGKEYSLDIHSELNHYTLVKLSLPIIRERGEDLV